MIRLEKQATLSGARMARMALLFEADVFINASGAWCAELAQTVDLGLPVKPMSRESYFFRCGEAVESLPFIKTETDLAFRPEGQGYVGGVFRTNQRSPGGFFQSLQSASTPLSVLRLPSGSRQCSHSRIEMSWRGTMRAVF